MEIEIGALLRKKLTLEDNVFSYGKESYDLSRILEITYSFPLATKNGLLEIVIDKYSSIPKIISFNKKQCDEVTKFLATLGEKDVNLFPKDKAACDSQIARDYPPKITCPRCGSDQISVNAKGLSIGRAAVGGVLAGGVGAILGGLSSGKVKVSCLKCGHSWIAGKRR